MSDSVVSNPKSGPRRWWLYAPAVIVGVLAVLWSGVWYYAAGRVETVLTAWMEREASLGRTYDCASRSVGGYPFRIEVRCREPQATLKDPGGGEPVVLKAKDLTAIAQVYQPDLVIVEAVGPMSVATASGQALLQAEWTLLQASVRGRPRAPQRVSLVVDKPRVREAGSAGARELGDAQRLEFHARRNPQAPADAPVFDLVTRLQTATIRVVPQIADKPLTFQATGKLTGLNDFTPRPMRQRLRDWQAAGGRIEVVEARFQQADALGVATGALGLNGEGRVEGALNLKIAGLDQVADLVLGQSVRGRNSILAGLAILGRSDLEGRRAVSVPLAFRDGRVFFGPVPIAEIPPVF